MENLSPPRGSEYPLIRCMGLGHYNYRTGFGKVGHDSVPGTLGPVHDLNLTEAYNLASGLRSRGWVNPDPTTFCKGSSTQMLEAWVISTEKLFR